MRLNLIKRNNPVNMAGDGKTPNRWWVTASTDFAYWYRDKGGAACIDHAEDLMKEHGIESKGFKDVEAVFSTLKEAVQYVMDELWEQMPPEPEKDRIHRITIEDRLNGEVWEAELIAHPRKWGGWSFEIEQHGDFEAFDILKAEDEE
jgi:hypothetical protein